VRLSRFAPKRVLTLSVRVPPCLERVGLPRLQTLAALAVALSSCTGSIDSINRANGGEAGGSVGGAAQNGGLAEEDAPSSPGSVPGNTWSPLVTCATDTTYAGPAPLTRLTTVEYRNTLAALFPRVGLSVTNLTLPAEVATEGFTNTAETQTPSAALIEALSNNAHSVAEQVTADLTKLLPCSPASASEETACGHQFVRELGRRAFRGELSAADQTRYDNFFDGARRQWGFRSAVQLVVEAMLQSPKLLYRMEAGAPEGTALKLDSHELANRLAYFLTDSMPDDALLVAADRDELGDPVGLERHARRLLASRATRDAVSTFASQWLRFDRMDSMVKAPDLFPGFTQGTASSLKRATALYVERMVWDEGHTLHELLTDNHAYVNAEIAPIYAVAAPAGSEFALVELDASQRSGILTQAGLMAGFAHERADAPVLRGIFVLDRLLCTPPAAPPRGVNTVLPELGAGARLTTREQLEESHKNPGCAACHASIDGLGFAFGAFDAIGQHRTSEFGLPINDSGELRGTDVDGPFRGAVELGQKLAQSEQVRQCVANQLLRYALAATRMNLSPCMVDAIAKKFEASGGDLRELLIAVVTSDAFRYRQVE
jgi:hypothetical protein